MFALVVAKTQQAPAESADYGTQTLPLPRTHIEIGVYSAHSTTDRQSDD